MEIDRDTLEDYGLRIIHLFRGHTYHITGLESAERHLRYRKYWRDYILDLIAQKRFNARTKFRRDRIELLRTMVDMALSDDNTFDHKTPTHPVDLLKAIYGVRIYAHPYFEKELSKHQFLFDSLVASGELRKIRESGSYILDGKSISTLSKYDEEERRHWRNWFTNAALVLLTAILALTPFSAAIKAAWKALIN